jgi:hypothetical protein
MGLANWLMRLLGGKGGGSPQALGFSVPGWKETEHDQQITTWQDAAGDVLYLRRDACGFPDLSDSNAVRRHCRELAQRWDSGLVQADVVAGADGPAVMLITKRLFKPAFAFTGKLVVAPASETSFVWTVVCVERGTTGVREATITAMLTNEGKLTVESYESSWAQDPYDPAYAGVDRSSLRYLSDDKSYDLQFPQHPLSKVRRELNKLLAVKLVQAEQGANADLGRDAGS